MKSTSAELSLELQSQETHLTNCILTVLSKGFTVGFCANIIQSGIFLLWASCRQAQPGATGGQGCYSHYFCFPSHNSFPPCHCTQVEFLVTDYIVSNISKAFHCCLWAQWLLELKRKEIKFHEGRWGAVISTRAQPPEAQPFSKPATEQVWKRPCNIALTSHPASINTPCLNCLLASPSVTKNTWTLSRKYYSNLQMQQFLSIFLSQNTGTASLRKRFHFNLRVCLFYMHFFPETSFSVSATVLEPCDSLLFLFERNPTHTEHGCHLAPYPILKKGIEQIINRGEQEETELL